MYINSKNKLWTLPRNWEINSAFLKVLSTSGLLSLGTTDIVGWTHLEPALCTAGCAAPRLLPAKGQRYPTPAVTTKPSPALPKSPGHEIPPAQNQ